ncbi:MAG: porin [Prevotella sp.]
MKQSIAIGALIALTTIGAQAQEKEKKISVVSDIKFSGYVMTQYQYSSQENSKSNSFNLRMARMSLEGRVLKDFYWKTQIQFNGNTSNLGNSPRVVDLFAEWQKYSFFKVKLGQYKRPFTFENPMNPIDQGFMSYSQNVSKLAGFSDRVGEHASNGRDMGLQIQGDLLKNNNGRNLLHYQIGVFNGQGINVKDVDQQKDIIGGVWVMPVKGLRIGAFGWTGTYARKGTWEETDATGNVVEKSGTRSLDRNRYAISAEYAANDWTLRSEYIHSQGYGFKTTYQDVDDAKDCTINKAAGDKADGLYALVIAPIIKKKMHVKARYDMYRPRAEWGTSKTQYEVGADYEFHRNLKISAEYAFVNDRSLAKTNYNMIDVEVSVRF